MRQLHIAARSSRPAREVFEILCDFDSYGEQTETVREVVVEPLGENRIRASWEVNFRDGILKWIEENTFHPDAMTIEFAQVEGDMEHYAGSWTVEDQGDSTLVHFRAEFDLGIPTLAHILDPIAERTLGENIVLIMQGLIGSDIELVDQTAGAAAG